MGIDRVRTNSNQQPVTWNQEPPGTGSTHKHGGVHHNQHTHHAQKGHSHGHKKHGSDTSDPTDPSSPQYAQYVQMAQDAGIDKTKFREALKEIKSSGAKIGSDTANAIFQKHGIDSSLIPPLPQAGNEGGPSADGRRRKPSDANLQTVLNRAFGEVSTKK